MPNVRRADGIYFFVFCKKTVFSVVASGQRGMAGIVDFFTYLPYNFTIALPIQMLVVAPLSLRLARLAGE